MELLLLLLLSDFPPGRRPPQPGPMARGALPAANEDCEPVSTPERASGGVHRRHARQRSRSPDERSRHPWGG